MQSLKEIINLLKSGLEEIERANDESRRKIGIDFDIITEDNTDQYEE